MGEIGILAADGMTAVPDLVRKRLGLKPGSQLEWTVENGRATVRVVPEAVAAVARSPAGFSRRHRLADLAGVLGAVPGRPVSLEEMDKAIAEAVAERYRHAVDRG